MALSFEDHAKFAMIRYAALFGSLGSLLDHLFAEIGNGMKWVDGALTDGNDVAHMAALPALERAACHETEADPYISVPWYLRFALNLPFEKAAPTQKRLDDLAITSMCALSRYSRILSVPDNVRQDWFNAACSYLEQVQQTPFEYFRDHDAKQSEDERTRAKKEYAATLQLAAKTRAALDQRFPQFAGEFKPVFGTIVLDPNRSDAPGSKYWPIDVTVTVPREDLVAGFKSALEFCYKFEPRPDTTPGKLDRILDKAAEAAELLGKRVVNNRVQKDIKLGESKVLKAVAAKYADLGPIAYFDDLVAPYCDLIKDSYRLRRINRNKSIPYTGYPLERNQATCLEPVEMFSAAGLRHEQDNQGRSALESIVGMLFTVISSNGARMITADFLKVCEGLPPQKTARELLP